MNYRELHPELDDKILSLLWIDDLHYCYDIGDMVIAVDLEKKHMYQHVIICGITKDTISGIDISKYSIRHSFDGKLGNFINCEFYAWELMPERYCKKEETAFLKAKEIIEDIGVENYLTYKHNKDIKEKVTKKQLAKKLELLEEKQFELQSEIDRLTEKTKDQKEKRDVIVEGSSNSHSETFKTIIAAPIPQSSNSAKNGIENIAEKIEEQSENKDAEKVKKFMCVILHIFAFMGSIVLSGAVFLIMLYSITSGGMLHGADEWATLAIGTLVLAFTIERVFFADKIKIWIDTI